MIPVIGLAVGIVAGLVLKPTVPTDLQPYLPIAIVAALDAVMERCGRWGSDASTTASSSCRSSPTS